MTMLFKGHEVEYLGKVSNNLSRISEQGIELTVRTNQLKEKKQPRVSRDAHRAMAESQGLLPHYPNDFKGREWKREYATPENLVKWLAYLLRPGITRLNISSSNPEETAEELGIDPQVILLGVESHGAKFDLAVKDSMEFASAPEELGIWVNPNQRGLQFDELGIGSRGLAELLMEAGLVPERATVLQ